MRGRTADLRSALRAAGAARLTYEAIAALLSGESSREENAPGRAKS